RRIRTSGCPTPNASARITTSRGPGCGRGTSTYSRASGPPTWRTRTVFICTVMRFLPYFENTIVYEIYCNSGVGARVGAIPARQGRRTPRDHAGGDRAQQRSRRELVGRPIRSTTENAQKYVAHLLVD